MRIPMKGGSEPCGQPLRRLLRAAHRVFVLLRVGPVPVAVLEIDAEVFDGLALELGHHPRVDLLRQLRREAQGIAEDVCVGSMLAQGPQSQLPELARGVGPEELAPPYTVCTGWRSGESPGWRRPKATFARRRRASGPFSACGEREVFGMLTLMLAPLRPWAGSTRCGTRA